MSILLNTAVSDMKFMTSIKSLAVLLLLAFSGSLYSQCLQLNGSSGTDVTGTQGFTGRLGMRFSVNSPISVTRLGAFDSDQNGFNSTITVAIVDAAGTVVVPSTGTPLTLTGFIGTYNGPFQMVGGFTPVTLTSGDYTVVAFGYGPSEFNGNTNFGSSVAPTNDGGGLITHIDSPWDNTAAMGVPTNVHSIGGFHAGNFTFSALTPVLSTNINGVVVNSNNDGIDDTGSFAICHGTSPNLTITSFIDATAQSNVWVEQEIVNNNTSVVPWCSGCAAQPGDFAGATATVTLLNTALPGTVTLRFRAFIDADGSDDFTAGECAGDWIVYTINVNAPVTSVNITAVPDGDVCIGATNVQYNAVIVGGTDVNFDWCAYNTGDGSGTCFNGFNDNSIQNPTRSWTATTGPKSVGVTVSQPGCPDVTDLYAFNVAADPIAPTLNIPSPGTGIVVCQGSTVSATVLPGSGGTGTCVDEFQYSVDNGLNWLPYTPGSNIVVGTMTVIIQGRRVCDGPACDGAGEVFANLFSWPVSLNPIASIIPDPAADCILTDIQLNGNPSGGSGTYSSHLWTGAGATYLNNTTIVNPIFNHNTIGTYNLVYRVTDSNGCTATDDINVSLRDVGLPEISCPASPVTMSADPDRCTAVVCFPVSAMDLCPVNLPTTLAGHTFIGTFNGHSYFRSIGTFSWEAANAAAVAVGGHMVSVNSLLEKNWLLANTPSNWYWIGLRYSPSLGQFKWTSGEPVTYTNWGIGQPGVLIGDYVYSWEIPFIGGPIDLGWYDDPGLINRRYIVEFQGFPVTLVSGFPSGSNFPVGTTSVTYRATDSAGNIDECTFDVVVTDDQAPEITCSADVTIQLDPLECEGIALFANPTTDDNCPGETFSLISPLPSGALFPIGESEVTFEATDVAGNTAQCSLTVTVLDYFNPSLGCINVNLSLDEDCEGELTPTEVLTGWEGPMGEILLGCLDLYDINIVGANGENLGNTVGNDQLGKTLQYTITNANGFICWGDVTVEDKIKPTIICPTVPLNVDCLTDVSKIAPPLVDDNCSEVRAVLVNEVHEALQCDANFIGRVTKTWKAVDGAGNESELLCVQIINLLRSNTNGITPPPLNVTLQCSDNYARDNKGFGYPAPSVTGIPLYGVTPLYPLSQLNMLYCNSTIDYTDVLIVNTKCKKRILRTWTITEWWCSTAVQKFMSMQTIDIVDTTAPVIPAQADITVTTQTRSCSASVSLPRLNITDNCTEVYKVYVNAYLNGLPSGYINGNGGSIELEAGIHTITYSALDECGNQSEMSYRITVRDDTDPVAICDQFATISIKTNGYTEITAQAIDDGSFDECGAVTLKVRRMEDPCSFGQDTAWFDKVGFCCLDANTTRMVQLLVTDAGENTNICMVSVNVQEKVDPRITCLPDITIDDCLYTFDPLNPAAYFGAIVIDDNCPANNQLREVVTDNRNQCGIGTVVRTTSVIAGGITYQTCTQTITFRNDEPFYINDLDHTDPTDDVVWPSDYTALGQCSPIGLDPVITGQVTFTEDACDLVGSRYEDVVYPFTTNGACYKIIRTWTVIDWCQTDIDGNHRTWSHDQEIKVMDNVIPTITSATTPKLVLTYDGQCQDGQIVLTASATDCTPANELRWTWVVTRGGITFRTGVSSVASGTYPIGVYKIEFTVEDKCGNLAKTGYDFEIRNAKAPTAICMQGLSASLGLMDSDGNGIGDTIMTILKPGYFDNKSSHVCGYTLKLSFSSDVNDTIASFSCADRGPQTIQMWVTDVNGNTSYCQTFVDIQDTQGLCPTMIMANVSGKTVKEDNTEIENVIVEMKGSELNPTNTDKNGHFAFAPMPTGGSYQVIPGKDGDDMNGVSTLDIVMIQRHILGMEKLNSPYKLIAADANNSGNITAADLVELRKLVLGLTMSLPNNTSWRFVDAAYQFVDKKDPWLTPFAERYNIDALTGHMDINFVGIKVGDVNGNAKGSNISGSTVEKRSKLHVMIDDRKVSKGEIIEIPVMLTTGQTIYGMQGEWKTDGLIIREIKEGGLDISREEYVITDVHHSAMSIAQPDGKTMLKNEVMFVIEVEAIRSGKLSEMIELSERVSPEIYVTDMETKTLGISWREKTETDFSVTGTTPNPWNTNATITFELPLDGMVSFKVKDYTGRKLISTIDQYSAGRNTIQLSRLDIGHSGVYVYELRYGDKVISGKMILID